MAEELVEREENEIKKQIFSYFIVFLLSFLSIPSMLTNAAGNATPTANKLRNDRSRRMASIDVNKGIKACDFKMTNSIPSYQFDLELPIRSWVTNSILSYQFDLELPILGFADDFLTLNLRFCIKLIGKRILREKKWGVVHQICSSRSWVMTV